MSKIHAVRLININYNNNAIRISDECFHFNGESTLLSLRNGGGKSVLVQMMTAPFVHKRYRDAKDRPFESYFTTNKPSFILVEWALDQGAGYVMTGMMVRRNQNMDDSGGEPLEMINVISEYRSACIQDIHHLPVVEKGKKEMVLKNFAFCRQLFETYKKDRSQSFYCYDMNNSAQSRQYFVKLQEYQINYKEWETIIKKINLEESGLSRLFADCKDEKGLVEKWFLEAVENKLNKEQNRVREFQMILEKYVGQYKDNQGKIQRRDTIRLFKEEAEQIREKGSEYQQWELAEQKQENRIAGFWQELERLERAAREQQERILQEKEMLQTALDRVEYERLSSEIYALEDQKRFHVSNRDMIEMEQESLEREADRISGILHLLSCARSQEMLDEECRELELVRQKLLTVQQKEEELEPERRSLGGRLRFYYGWKSRENEERSKENLCLQQVEKERMQEYQRTDRKLERQIQDNATEMGALGNKVRSYDREEEEYNRRYQGNLARNILGEYEPGSLEILLDSQAKELEEKRREKIRKKNEQELGKEQQKVLERTLEDLRSMRIRQEMEQKQQTAVQEHYEEELKVRRVILKYLDLEEEQLFDREGILRAAGSKLQEIAQHRRNLEKEEDILQKEYRRLTQGKTLEIPAELEEELEKMGIHPVYGMEWLQKNGNTEEENRQLVRRHPFLPYALILTRQELEKLKENPRTVYTSFPIPVIVRESLSEKRGAETGSVISLSGISFYLWFNENLLNEEKLRQMVLEKEQQIRKKQEAIAIRQQEYEAYFKRQEIIENQEVTKKNYEKQRQQLEELAEQLRELDEKTRKTDAEKNQLEERLDKLEEEIRAVENQIVYGQRRQEDLERLKEIYEEYLENRRQLEQCKRQAERLRESRKLVRQDLEKSGERLRTLELDHDRLEEEGRKIQQQCLVFEKYEEEEFQPDPEEVEKMELRYEAVTGNLSLELQELERQEKQAAGRAERARGDLERLQVKYHLKPGAWKDTRYNAKEETHQEILLEDCRKKIENRQMLWREEDKQIAVLEQQETDRRKRMQEECGQESPVPRGEIQEQDFEARKNQLRYQKTELEKEQKKWERKLHSYEENLTALSEFSDFVCREPVEWEQEPASMDSRELRNFKGILVRDYNQILRDKQGARERLQQAIHQMVRMEAFQDEFYKKPLEALLEVSHDGGQVLGQLALTIQSYDSLMEKLEVDISLVEKEKAKIVELLEEYIREVHLNLGKIDRNSTITIRERPVKMLKIQLPDWETGANLYHIRLEDMIDEITQKGLEIFQKNENAQEYFGTRITTRNLYDAVVGIGNVQIRLYKIEAQREYPITWTEVARNSGGEGFLSAFVVLSSLLYYMRRDETDIFADRNEGKVLVMDNPFAQTNAAHLLKPLMDMAEKTNTQLICLTGLGGESIYSRFQNIYVLNLVTASLRNGQQYLRADHLRGNEPETILASHIEVVEQQELLF